MKYGISGPRKFNSESEELVYHALMSFKDLTELTSGAQFGVDTFGALVVHEEFPDAVNRIIVPAAKHNEDSYQFATEIIYLPESKEPYRDRNTVVIDHSEDGLIAFPKTNKEEFRGSGTWMAIRQAQKRNVPVFAFPLNGQSIEL